MSSLTWSGWDTEICYLISWRGLGRRGSRDILCWHYKELGVVEELGVLHAAAQKLNVDQEPSNIKVYLTYVRNTVGICIGKLLRRSGH